MNPEQARYGKRLCLLLCCFLGILILCTIILGSVPPVDRDALTHHLFVPKLWLMHGILCDLPEIRFSYYPMTLDLLYTIPLALGNDIIPKYIHYLFALCSAGLIFMYLRKRLGLMYAILGALFFLSIPVVLKLSITVYVDLGVVFFSTASLLLLLFWAEHEGNMRYLLLAGICCGLAAGVKYNGLVTIVVLTLLTPLIYTQLSSPGQGKISRAVLFTALFALATVVIFSPWMIRNTVLTGNPIYPLHNHLVQSVLHPETNPSTTAEQTNLGDNLRQLTSKGSSDFTTRRILYDEPLWRILLLPIRIFFEGQDDNPQYFDGKLNPFLLILPMLAFYFRTQDVRQRKEQLFLALFAALYFFFTFFQEATRIRYVAAIIPALVILSMYGLRGVIAAVQARVATSGGNEKTPLIVGGLFCLLMLGYNTMYLINQFHIVQPFAYLSAEVDRDTYITAFRPEYAAVKQANAQLSPDTKVLCLFLGNRGYYMDFKPIFEQPYAETSLLFRFLYTEGDILNFLREKQITHVLMRDDMAQDWWENEQWWQTLPPEGKARLLPLMKASANPLYRGYGHTFFQVPSTK